MSEFQYYYELLRRLRLLLLIGVSLGAIGGAGVYLQGNIPITFTATANFSLSSRVGVLDTPDLQTFWRSPFKVVSGPRPTQREAVEYLVEMSHLFEDLSKIPITVGDLSIQEQYDAAWWRSALFGSVIGGLMALGAAYVWTDVRAHQLHQREIAPPNT